MRLLMTLLVRDEVDAIAANLEHHLAAGVDYFMVTDNGSVDGTVEVLQHYRDAGVLNLIHEPGTNYDQAGWVTKMARSAYDYGADWVINADADEFFWPLVHTDPAADLLTGAGVLAENADLQLPSVLAGVGPEFGSVTVRRDNLVAAPGVSGSWPFRLTLRDRRSLSERGTRIGHKVVHRADRAVQISQGNHTVTGPRIGPPSPTEPLVILHVPDRSFDQYSNKIRAGGAGYAANTEVASEAGWHWREDYQRLQDGQLRQTWLSRQLDTRRALLGIAAGDLVATEQLRDRLSTLQLTALLPAQLARVVKDSAAAESD